MWWSAIKGKDMEKGVRVQKTCVPFGIAPFPGEGVLVAMLACIPLLLPPPPLLNLLEPDVLEPPPPLLLEQASWAISTTMNFSDVSLLRSTFLLLVINTLVVLFCPLHDEDEDDDDDDVFPSISASSATAACSSSVLVRFPPRVVELLLSEEAVSVCKSMIGPADISTVCTRRKNTRPIVVGTGA